jgi:hypothetical protein
LLTILRPFISPILFPDTVTLPPTLQSISPITSAAHPLITNLSCALLHPDDPSCLRTYISYWIRVFPRLARFFGVILAAFSLLKYKSFYSSPISSLDKLGRSVLRLTAFTAGSVGTSWGAICLFQSLFPKSFLPTQRFFLGGFMGGLWGFLEKDSGRGNFLYCARLSMDSGWKVGKKRGWWKGVKGGDVWLFVVALAACNAIYTKDVDAIPGGVMRRVVAGLRGESAAMIESVKDVDEEK